MKFNVTEGSKMPSMGLKLATVFAATLITEYGEKKTPQLQVSFKPSDGSDDWSISKFYNLRGYEHNEDGSVKKDKDGNPIVSQENTDKALAILGRESHYMGLKPGEASEQDLIGLTCGILIEPNIKGKPSVTKVYSYEYAEELV